MVVGLLCLLPGCRELNQRTTPTLEEQTRCDKRANEIKQTYNLDGVITSQTNHYNPSLGICAVRVSNLVIKPVSRSEDVINGFEHTTLASYAEDPDTHKVVCHVVLPNHDIKYCTRLFEFEELIKVYMQ
jgi:hypothetical protein